MAPQQPHGDRARCGARQMQQPRARQGGAGRRLRPHRGDATPIRPRADVATETGTSARRVRGAVARQGLARDRDDRPR